ncbi:hypothetical protein [Croceicoccus hydrothermalis]|uniref:hypothetical protein n=1 Tax=Croceicoccus hydrothermalis TaxID=2867964 RepID=UPI001EFB09B0|nr:hypothetical protein [Croceicoccus hydrothermalis]
MHARLASQADKLARLSLSDPGDIGIVQAYMSDLEYLRKCEVLAPTESALGLPFASVELSQMAENLKMAFPVSFDNDLDELALRLCKSN